MALHQLNETALDLSAAQIRSPKKIVTCRAALSGNASLIATFSSIHPTIPALQPTSLWMDGVIGDDYPAMNTRPAYFCTTGAFH